ncbi:MAG: response regulator [Terriglobales bacterium]
MAKTPTLLLVDDDYGVLQMVASVLRTFGFNVIAEADSLRALEMVTGGTAEITVLVCDFDMPGVNGVQLARAAKKHRPTVPVLILSGRFPPDLQPAPWDAWFVKGMHTTELVAQLQALTQSCTSEQEGQGTENDTAKGTTLSAYRLAMTPAGSW